MPELEGEAVEVQAGGGHNSVFVFSTRPVDEDKINSLLKNPEDSDESTARTETLTDVDENSLRDKFSFASHSSTESSGTFRPHDNIVHAPRQLWRAHSNQVNLLSIGEAIKSSCDQTREFQKNSLFDLDFSDDEDDRRPGIKLVSENETISLYFDSNDESESCDKFRDTLSLYSESRAEFYRGYSIGNSVRDKVQNRERSASSRSMFPADTLNTNSCIAFYRVSSSINEEPLSCSQKLEQVGDTLQLNFI
jgi:hypothetical protein